jgi:hypothetical protein
MKESAERRKIDRSRNTDRLRLDIRRSRNVFLYFAVGTMSSCALTIENTEITSMTINTVAI